jgi:hypothetical protein
LSLSDADQSITARFADFGLSALAGSPADLGTLIVGKTEKWRNVIRVANIKPE